MSLNSIGTLPTILSQIASTGQISATSIEAMTKALSNMSAAQIAATVSASGLNAEQVASALRATDMTEANIAATLSLMGFDKEAIHIAISMDTLTAEEQKNISSNIELAASQTAASATTKTLGNAFQGLATKLGISTTALGVITAIIAALGVASIAIKKYNEHQQELVENATSAGQALDEERDQLDSYYESVSELRKQLDSGELSEEETVSVKNQILDIQQQIVDQYGDQAYGIDLVNGKLETELGILQRISQENAQEYIYDSDNQKGAEKAIKEMEKVREAFIGTYTINETEAVNALDEILKKYRDKGIEFDELIVNGERSGQYNIKFVGDASQMKETLGSIMNDIRGVRDEFEGSDYGLFDNFYNSINESYNDAKDVLDEYQDLYETWKRNELVADEKEYGPEGNQKQAIEWVNEYTEAIENYNDALSSGDLTQIDESYQKLHELQTIIYDMIKNDPDGFGAYADNFYEIEEGINSAAEAANKFDKALSGDKSSNELKKISDAADRVKSLDFQNFADFRSAYMQNSSQVLSMVNLAQEIGLISDDSASSLQILYDKLAEFGIVTNPIVEQSEELKQALSFSELLTDSEGKNTDFADTIDDYIKNIQTLQEALQKLRSGDGLENSDIQELIKDFPELASGTDDFETAIQNLINTMNTDMLAEFEAQLQNVATDDDRAALEAYANAVLEVGTKIPDVTLGVNDEIESLDNLKSALSETTSATGLTDEGMQAIINRYKELDSYDPSTLFERTANGIHLNREELRKLESEYDSSKTADYKQQLSDLTDQYNTLTSKINNCKDAQELANLYSQRSEVEDQITDVQNEAAAYDALTSAYNRWQMAQSGGEEMDSYEDVGGWLETAQDYIDRGWTGREDLRQFVDLLSYKDLSNATGEEVKATFNELMNNTISGTKYSVADFFKFDENDKITTEGIANFFDAVHEKFGDEYAKMTDEGWSFDFGGDKSEEIAKAFGIDPELIQTLIKAAISGGMEVSLDTIWDDIDLVATKAEQANSKLNELGYTDYEFHFNTDSLDTVNNDLDVAKSVLDQFRNEDGTINLEMEGAAEAQTVVAALVAEKGRLEQPAIMEVDASTADEEFQDTISTMQDLWNANNNYEAYFEAGLDTSQFEDQKRALTDKLKGYLKELDDEELNKLGINTELDLDNLNTDELLEIIDGLNPEILAKLGIDTGNLSDTIKESVSAALSETTVTVDVNGNTKPLEEDVENTNLETSAEATGVDMTKAEQEAANHPLQVPVDVEVAPGSGTKGSDYWEKYYGSNLVPGSEDNTIKVIADTEEATEKVNTLQTLINRIEDKTVRLTAKVIGQSKLDTLKETLDSIKSKTVTVTTNLVTSTSSGSDVPEWYKKYYGSGGVNGTANASGTAHANGTANASGDWGVKKGGKALFGELGQELMVDPNTGTWHTVGDYGAEIADVPKGAIIFNHKQTEALLKYGRVIGRGVAMVNGTAFSSGSGGLSLPKTRGTNYNGKSGSSSISSSSSKSSVSSSTVAATQSLEEALKDTLDEMKETMDDLIGDYEHQIFLLEKQGGSADEIVGIYQQMQDAVTAQIEEYRKLGLEDNSDYIQDLEEQWYEYADSIQETIVDAYEKVRSEQENAATLTENWRDNDIDTGDTQSLQRHTQEIIQYYKNAQDTIHQEAEYYRSLGYSDTSDEVSELSDAWYEYRDNIIEAMETAHEAVMGQYENSNTLNENWLNQAISSNDTSGIIKYTKNITDNYKGMMDEVHQQAEYYRSLGYSDTSDEVSELSDQWWQYYEEMKNVSAEAWQQVVDNASDAVDTITGLFDTMKNAAKDYAESGYITVDTFQQLCDLGVENLAYLEDENGQLVINEENINKVIAARVEQLAVETALSYIAKLRIASENNDIATLNNLTLATQNATNSTWGMVFAQLELLNLTDEQTAGAKKYINMLYSLTQTTIKGIGQVDSALQDTLNKQSDALDDLLKYVEQMIQQEIRNQTEALEDQADAYKDIVEYQKKSLQLEKEKNEYTKSVTEKEKEIAKIRQQLAMLELDDSRESLAKQAELREELAEKIDDLNELQADKAYDLTEEMLDESAEAYEKEKDDEIKILEDTISSEEKLYRLCIDRIDNQWDTLYSDLRNWCYEYGNITMDTLNDAWDSASAAVERYGSYLEAVKSIQEQLNSITNQDYSILGDYVEYPNNSSDIVKKMYQNSQAWWGAGKDDRSTYESANESLAKQFEEETGMSLTKKNGSWYIDDTGQELYSAYGLSAVSQSAEQKESALAADKASVRSIVSQMNALSKSWSASMTKEQKDSLHNQVAALAEQLKKYGVYVSYNSSSGVWTVTKDALNSANVGKSIYAAEYHHTGGAVGNDPTLKQNEIITVAEKGELVLTEKQQDNLYRILDFSETMLGMYGSLLNSVSENSMLRDSLNNQIKSNNQQAQNVVNYGGDTINNYVTIPVTVKGEMTDAQIDKLKKEVSNYTVQSINDAFYKRGKH